MTNAEQELMETARGRLFNLLSDLKWHGWRELRTAGGVRYGARLLELRRLGYEIKTAELDVGKQYRLVSCSRAEPQVKRVKVFLEEPDADQIVANGIIPDTARRSVADALGSFRTNRNKL